MFEDAEAILSARGIQRSPPESRDGVKVFRFGAERDFPIDLYIYRDVLDELVFAAGYEEAPSIAIVTGGFGVSGGRGFVEMNGFEEFAYIEGEFEPFEALAEGCRRLQQDSDDEYPVALFCSLRDSHALIPPEFARLHLTFFNVPFQPLVMLDPTADEVAFYARAPRRGFVDTPIHVVTRAPSAGPDAVSA